MKIRFLAFGLLFAFPFYCKSDIACQKKISTLKRHDHQSTCLGSGAGAAIKTRSGNTCIGFKAANHTSRGCCNTAVGEFALKSNVKGSDNIAIGAHADVGQPNLCNAIAIGNCAKVFKSNTIQLGNLQTKNILTSASITCQSVNSISDLRLKTDIQENVPGIAFIHKLRPITYRYTCQENQNADSAIRAGFIAQEVERAATELHFDFDGVCKPQTENDVYTLSYSSFVVPLAKAVQEQQEMIEQLKQKIADLARELESIKNK